ncbi:MAG TPA: acetamidase/formamidase family protein [Opitutaceae bacterium]|nr:acetamidase/formamidase family protein [Opitutaceae bacterium]
MHHTLAAAPLVHRFDRDTPPRLTIESGDTVTFECADSSGWQVQRDWTAADYRARFDPEKVHALTGPVHVAGAKPGDTLEIGIVAYRHHGWAWTSIRPDFGLLPDDFPEHRLFIWELGASQTRSFPGVTLDLHPFAGIIGVQRAESGEFRTRAPGPFGGNMDVRQLGAGTRLFLPVLSPGAGVVVGDCHAAQGDGEVCINGMEAPMDVTLTFSLHRGRDLSGPYAIFPGGFLPPRYEAKPWHLFVESDEHPREACRRAVRRAIDFIVRRLGVTPDLAYMLSSVVLDLRISQLVNHPTTTITACLPDAIFD